MESDDEEDKNYFERPKGRPKKVLEDATDRTKRRRINKDFTVGQVKSGSPQDKRGSPSPDESGSSGSECDKEDPTILGASDCFGYLPDYGKDDLLADLRSGLDEDGMRTNSVKGQNLSAGDFVHDESVQVLPHDHHQIDDFFLRTNAACDSDNYAFDINDLGPLYYDCDVCIACRCVNCDECIHSDNGNCSHGFSCLCDLDSELGDSDNDFEELESSGESEDEVVVSEEAALNNAIKSDLVDVCLNNNLSHQAIDDLMILGFMQKYNVGNFPRRGKTLLKTERQVKVREVPPGQYWHNGITKHLINYATSNPEVSVIDVSFSSDGVPLFNSSSINFWPLTCAFNHDPQVYVIGLYLGDKKPCDPNDYLKDFVEEIIPFCESGLHVKNRVVTVNVVKAIFDVVAKSWILSVMGCNSKRGCFKCLVEGETEDHRTYFIDLNAALRTDESFLNHLQSLHHKGWTIFVKIPRFGCVTSVPLDYMHLALLGTMRKLVYMWIGGPLAVRQGSAVINAMSEELVNLVGWVPCEFARKTRSLQHVKRFKATEYRLLLLYVGVVVFRRLPRRLYEHFLAFHVFMTIFVDPVLCKTHLNYAKELSVYFVQTFNELYGKQFVSHNVHYMIHIHEDVERFDEVDKFSAFKFENFYQQLKKMVRKGDRPLQQVAKRCLELEARDLACARKSPTVAAAAVGGRHISGTLLDGCKNPQFSSFTLKGGFELNLSEANRCCLLDDSTVVLADNFATGVDGNTVVIGRQFLKLDDVYEFTCPSSVIGIYNAHQLSKRKAWPASRISRKCFRMPWKSGFAVLPM